MTASEDSNTDLFWALRGAGHNFGIVTEWEYRIYDINNPKWSYEIFIFLGDKLEDVLELKNRRAQDAAEKVNQAEDEQANVDDHQQPAISENQGIHRTESELKRAVSHES